MSALRTSLGICVAFALFSASCKPDKQPIPTDLGMKTEIPEPELPIVDGVYGAMYSLKIYETENGKEVKSESANAEFYDQPSNTATATQATFVGTIMVNNYNLNASENNQYVRVNTQGNIFEDMNYEDSVVWEVEGDDGILAFGFSWSSKFPEYTGNFPMTIERNKDLIFTFDNNSVSEFTDSVFVVIAAGDKKLVKRYGAHEGTVTIPSAELTPLQACTLGNPGYLQISTSVVDIFDLINETYPVLLVKQVSNTRPIIIQ